jgi:hypothetical protein
MLKHNAARAEPDAGDASFTIHLALEKERIIQHCSALALKACFKLSSSNCLPRISLLSVAIIASLWHHRLFEWLSF